MIRSSIRTKILAIAIGMIVLMVITAVLSLPLVTQVGHRLEQMTNSYIPAYGNLARSNIRSLERALALRRMVIAKSRSPPDQAIFSTAREVFDAQARRLRESQLSCPEWLAGRTCRPRSPRLSRLEPEPRLGELAVSGERQADPDRRQRSRQRRQRVKLGDLKLTKK